MKIMQHDVIPRKYNLRWDKIASLIQIEIHESCVRNAMVLTKDMPMVEHFIEANDADGLFDSFSGDLRSSTFGFNESIRRVSSEGDYVRFLVPMPQVLIKTCFVCEDCSGTGERFLDGEKLNEKCLRCDGSGRKHVYDWRAAYLTSTSLFFLFNVLDLCEDSTAKELQHVIIYLMSDPGRDGNSVVGCFSIDLSDYLRQGSFDLMRVILPEVVQAMKVTYALILKLRKYDTHSFIADVRDGFLSLSCPGDACGIHLSDHHDAPGKGREFMCHNVDSPLQALTLLAGISALVGLVDTGIMAQKMRDAVPTK